VRLRLVDVPALERVLREHERLDDVVVDLRRSVGRRAGEPQPVSERADEDAEHDERAGPERDAPECDRRLLRESRRRNGRGARDPSCDRTELERDERDRWRERDGGRLFPLVHHEPQEHDQHEERHREREHPDSRLGAHAARSCTASTTRSSGSPFST
jgi:hypothetical protein